MDDTGILSTGLRSFSSATPAENGLSILDSLHPYCTLCYGCRTPTGFGGDRLAEPGKGAGMDLHLLRFLSEAEPTVADELLEELISTHAEPVINSIIRRKLSDCFVFSRSHDRVMDAADVRGDVILSLIRKLRECKAQPDENVISDFRGYVAVTTYHACDQYLRRKYPNRTALESKLRYLLRHDRQFALWETTGDWLCGFSNWSGTPPLNESGRVREGLVDSRDLQDQILPGQKPDLKDPSHLLAGIFVWAGGPLRLDDLISLVALLCGVKDQPFQDDDRSGDTNSGESQVDRLPDPSLSVEVATQQRLYLQKLWREICQLPVLQRKALLLNLRDPQGSSVIEFLPHLGVASISRIAEAIEIPALDFARLWSRLPLEDDIVAGLMNKTRQQVINLRKSARERLARRMKDFLMWSSGNVR